jgi:prolyl oligopeptidase
MRFTVVLALFSFSLAAQQRPPDLDKIFTEYYEWQLETSPEVATMLGRPDFNNRWSDTSPEGFRQDQAALERFKQRLSVFANAPLNEADRLNLRLIQQDIATSLQGIELYGPYFVVTQQGGPHLRPFSVLAMAPASTVKDYEDQIERIRGLAPYADGIIASASVALEKNLVAPRLVAKHVLQQVESQLAMKAEQSPLLVHFRNFPDDIPAADRQRLLQAATAALNEQFQPSWTRLRDYLRDTYLPKTRDTLAVTSLPGGREKYAFSVRRFTTTDLTPEQIHEIGRKEVDRILAEMAAIRKELRFTGTAEEFADKILMGPEMRFDSEEEILRHGRDIAKRLDPELPKLFRKLPRMTYGVRAIPADRARTAAPYYEPPAADGTRAGNFYLRTADPTTQSKCCMEALIIHEAVPGHHLQIALALEQEGVPEFRKLSFFGAFIEGWGLYAETLGPELGMYKSPYERYGKLQSEIFRAMRLVVDTGIHAKGWSRDQAVQHLSVAKGGFVNDAMVQSEVDRYIAWPGQALSYKIGGLKIEELRAFAEKTLGQRFDVREFHEVVLRDGAIPLDILEAKVKDWVATRKS